MIFGIQAAQDVKLSNIGRALGESIALKKTEERLSHHLAAAGRAKGSVRESWYYRFDMSEDEA